ncbi:MAG: DUF349 domain-containing protein [Bacteroidales bacterium]|jgi:hypothetical protein|nr:DUF349 domain-containing protein [Bacteroidales bacterium]
MEELQGLASMENKQSDNNNGQVEDVNNQEIIQDEKNRQEEQTEDLISSEPSQQEEICLVEQENCEPEISLQNPSLSTEEKEEKSSIMEQESTNTCEMDAKQAEIVQSEQSEESVHEDIAASPIATEDEDATMVTQEEQTENVISSEPDQQEEVCPVEQEHCVPEISLQDPFLPTEEKEEMEQKSSDVSEMDEKREEIVQSEQSEESVHEDIAASPITTEDKEEDAAMEIQREEKKRTRSESTSMTEVADNEEIEITDDFFDHLTRQEVVETMEDIVGEPDIVKIKKQIALLKIRFLKLNKEYNEERLQSFLANDGNKEDYDYSADELEIRFNKAFDRYKANKIRYTEELEQTKIVNLEKKRALLDELKVLIESSTDSLKQIYDRFKEIQTTWKEIGSVPQANVAELWQNYHFYVEKFFDKVKINRELRDLDLKKNLERKLEICEKTEALLLEQSIVKAFKLLQQYHHEWKESGPVDEEKREELWNRFKTASNKINQNRREHYERVAQQQEENYNAKVALCEEIEKIVNTEPADVKQLFALETKVSDLFKTWKSIGASPRDVQDEVWDRFRSAMDTFFTNKKNRLGKMKEDHLNNYNIKLNLCIQAEAIALRKDWKKATAEILALQDEWKQSGSFDYKQTEKLRKRFRKACDDFFTAKSDYFRNIQQYDAENLQKKEDLIKRVNEYVFVDSQDANFEALKEFQREWTSIGYTATSEKERLWNAFQTAIQKRFEELKRSVNTMDKTKYAERISGIMEKGNKSNETIAKEQRYLQSKIRQLTDDVNLWENNLGFFAHSKNSEELKKQFGKKIEDSKKEIQELQAKLAIIQKSKAENPNPKSEQGNKSTSEQANKNAKRRR